MRRIIVMTAVLTTLRVCPLLAAVWDTSFSSLILRVQLDHTTFVPGEPVLIGLSVENVGADPFEDLAVFEPDQNFMIFAVSRDGKEVGWKGPNLTWGFTHEGTRLLAGDRICDVINLLEYYGTEGSISHGNRTFRLRQMLEPGSYTVRAAFRARLGVRPDLPQVRVTSNEVHFVILDSPAISAPDGRALEILYANPRPSRSMNQWKAIREGDLRGSRYFAALADMYLPADSVDATGLANEYLESGGGVLGAVEVLRAKYRRFSGRLNACGAWLRQAKSQARSEFSCYLKRWEELVRLRRLYGQTED